MKRYHEYLDEITQEELFEKLVAFGLFTEKLPAFLSSESFFNFVKNKNQMFTKRGKDYIRYASVRHNNVPRVLAVPNPFSYYNQCMIIKDNWNHIKLHFKNKTEYDEYKISRIHLRKQKSNKSLFKMNYNNFMMDGSTEDDLRIKAKYKVCADISNCFPSIYSHSIAWAIAGKEEAKNNKDKKELFYNELDKYTRFLKNNETNGLLIGPHSSNLISEIILTSIDKKLSEYSFKYIRNIDDYNCYVESYDDAERFLVILSHELKEYDLYLNTRKTKVIPITRVVDEHWTHKLKNYPFVDTYCFKEKEGLKLKTIKGFINYATELMLSENSNIAILNYAIKMTSEKHLGKYAKQHYIKKIHHLVLLYPYLISLLEEYVFKTFEIEKETIKMIAKDIYGYGIKNKLYEASSYAIYWALKYNFQLNEIDIEADALESKDCIFMLISYLYDKKYKKKKELNKYKDIAKKLSNIDFNRYWLFIYEVLPKSDLENDFKEIKNNNISFVKDEFKYT